VWFPLCMMLDFLLEVGQERLTIILPPECAAVILQPFCLALNSDQAKPGTLLRVWQGSSGF
jgi:hypothetical protein